MAEKDSTTKHSPVPIHKKSEEQVSTAGATSSAQIEQVEHESAEKVAQKVLRETQRADSDPQGRSPTGTNESLVKGLSNPGPLDVNQAVQRYGWEMRSKMSQQVYNVKAVPAPPPGDFDLHRAKEEGFSPDTLKSAIERFYATVVIGLINAFKHFVRLRSSKETRRTAAFCVVYFAAWVLDLIIPTALSTLLLLIFFPSSLILLFPPVPISLVSCETGGAQQPKAGVVGSKGTVTGAPEKFKGEAVEQEASNLVSGASRLALECAGGKYDDEAQADDKKETSSLGDPANIVSKIADAATASRGGTPSEEHDKTKEPMMEIIREKGNTDNGVD
ncbi:hypothetical protein GX48_02292 [Paracoccidioides brasiliensis]|nr:hypothetical protein GX48_02292 [Paracoccidioides brasiliensis]